MKKLQFNVLLSTNDYTIFRIIKGNRKLDEVNVKRIIESMKESYEFTLVIVNEKMEVIDGQHRIEACKRLGLEITYIIIEGLDLTDVIRYNSIQKSWQKPQHLESQIDLGNQAYIWLYEFMKNYPEFSLGTAESILTNTYGGANKNKGIKDADGKLVGKKLLFQTGGLIITAQDRLNGYTSGGKIRMYKPYFKKYNNGIFVKTLISLFQNKKFDNDEMIRKIIQQPTLMVQCSTIKQYKLLLQDIYNHGKSAKKRISLYP